MSVPRWARSPFDLIVHAEMHRLDGEDRDRRIALVGFDNSIEVSIKSYLNLNPIHRNGRSYAGSSVTQWQSNFHTLCDFLDLEIGVRAANRAFTKADLVFLHEIRNGQYHDGGAAIPQKEDVDAIKDAAFWVFSFLFELSDVAGLVAGRISALRPVPRPARTPEFDAMIDRRFEPISIAGRLYSASEVLYHSDLDSYVDLGRRLAAGEAIDE